MTCTQPGCGGTVQDGYCDICGLAAAAAASGSAPSPWGPSASSGQSSRSGARSRGSSRSARGRLGAGLVEIPPVPYRDPASAVLADPQVPQNKRFCSGCDQPVGRDREGSGARPRALARLTPDEDRRIQLVDMANAIRPRTLT